MTIMPGASWRPITVPGGLSARTPGRAVILHVAASEAVSLFGFFNGNTSANSHFYVAKSGAIEQYIDTRYQAWTSLAANKNTIGVETQGGVTNADGEPWTAAQVESLARICAWAHTTEGVALTVMPNSLPTSKGIGYHRLGIDPWRIAGGEVWSSSRGKLCPGAAKIGQLPQIVARAQQIVNGAPTPTPTVQEDDMILIVNTTRGMALVGAGYYRGVTPDEVNAANQIAAKVVTFNDPADWDRAVALATSSGSVNRIHDILRGGDKDHDNIWLLWAALYGQNPPGNGNEIIKALGKVAAPALDEAKLAAALLADPASVDRLGAAIAAHLKLSSS